MPAAASGSGFSRTNATANTSTQDSAKNVKVISKRAAVATQAIVVRKDSSYNVPQDLCGKTVAVQKGTVDVTWKPAEHVERARAATGRPWTSPTTDRQLLALARRFLSTNVKPGAEVPQYQAELTQSALRHLLLSGPDACLH